MTCKNAALSLLTIALLVGCDGHTVLNDAQKAAIKQCEQESADTEIFWMTVPDKIYHIRCQHRDTDSYGDENARAHW